MVKYALILLCFLASTAIGQTIEFDESMKFPIRTEGEESSVFVTPDGKELFFTRSLFSENVGGQYAGSDVWRSLWNGSTWSKPTNLSFNTKGNDILIGISKAGDKLFLLRTFPGKKIKGIYFVNRVTNDVWGKPELIPIPGIVGEGFIGAYVSPEYDVIFISMTGEDSKGNEDLYFCVKDPHGKWSKPKNLGQTINTNGYELSPFLSTNKKRLYFSSSAHKGYGDADIYYSERLYDSWETWSAPVNLGARINSSFFESGLTIINDSLAIFSSNRNSSLATLYSSKIYISNKIYSERVLSDVEKIEILGENVKTILEFSGDDTSLQSATRELIFYIGNKLLGKRDIRIAIEYSPDLVPDLVTKRNAAIMAQLALSGIEGSRIVEPETSRTNSTLSRNQVNLLLIR